jgi:site-specific DNA recombinase
MNIFQQTSDILKAAIYTRVSTVKQVNEGFGLDTQKHRCTMMAEMKGWPIVKEYSDEGLSGTLDSKQRKGLGDMLEDAKNKLFDVLIFYSLDRLGRTTSIVLKTIEQLTNMNIKIVSCKESIDTSSPTGVFVLTIFAALAQLERDTIVTRMKEGKNERIKLDGECGGVLPYGYCRVDGKVSINPDESHIINSIFQAYYISKISMRKIAELLNKEEIKPPKGNIWYGQTIHKILQKREKYSGGSRNGSQVNWPVILINRYPEKKGK